MAANPGYAVENGRCIFSDITRTVYQFRGPYWFLSNFSPSSISYMGAVWPTAEHLFQAMKSRSWHGAERILEASTPAEAKKIGRKLELRDNWDRDRKQFMLEVVVKKFRQNDLLRAELCALEGWMLIEGNDWDDQFWGRTYESPYTIPTMGKNYLGKILMAVRDIMIED